MTKIIINVGRQIGSGGHIIAEKLAEQLEENGTARLRTEYALDDEIFNRIGREVYDYLTDEDAELYGYYWMGVIYLEKE